MKNSTLFLGLTLISWGTNSLLDAGIAINIMQGLLGEVHKLSKIIYNVGKKRDRFGIDVLFQYVAEQENKKFYLKLKCIKPPDGNLLFGGFLEIEKY